MSRVKLESEGCPCEPGRPPLPDTAALPRAVGGGSCNAAALGESSGSTLKKKCLFLTVNQRNKRWFIDRGRLGSHVESASWVVVTQSGSLLSAVRLGVGLSGASW